ERIRRDLGAGFEAPLEIGDVHRLAVGPERADGHRVRGGVSTQLAQSHVDRHLTALEAGGHLVRSGAGLLPLDPTAGIAALPGAEATADALPRPPRLGRLEVREIELVWHLRVASFDRDEVAHAPEHAPKLRRVLVL